MRQPPTNPDLDFLVFTLTILFTVFSWFTIVHMMIYRANQKRHRFELRLSEKAYQEQLRAAQIEVQEATYHHIATELHDNVGQLLSTTKMLMGVMQLNFPETPKPLLTASETLSKAIQELRLLSRSLDKEWLEQFSFLENLKNEVQRINESGTILATLDCESEIRMEPDRQVILFRVVQEAIQNAIRHGEPSQLHILIRQNETLTIVVRNNGKALPDSFHGMGTANMRQRVEIFGGNIEWQSSIQTVVTITIPLQSP